MRFSVYIVLGLLLCACTADDSFTIKGNDEVPDTFTALVWTRSFGGSGDESPRSIINTNDGGYAILGLTNSTDGDLDGKALAVNDYW